MRPFPPDRAVARIHTTALVKNFRQLQKRAGNAQIFAVVKANAYGHGLEGVTATLAGAGCTAFATATLEEACTVRLHAPGATILILGYTPLQKARLLSELSLTQTVFSARYAKALDAVATTAGRVISVHFKVDGGMTRLGFPADGGRIIRDTVEECPMPLSSPSVSRASGLSAARVNALRSMPPSVRERLSAVAYAIRYPSDVTWLPV